MAERVVLRGREVEVGTLPELIAARASQLGDKPLVHIEGEMLTYRAADERSNRMANALADLGVEPGGVVASFLYNSVDHVVLWFACAKLGAIWAPLNVSLVGDDLAWTLADTGARFVVVDAELMDAYRAVRDRLPALDLEVLRASREQAEQEGMRPIEDLAGDDASPPAVVVLPSTPMAITYTGGSTGMPKGVLVAHLYYIATGIRFHQVTSGTPDDVHVAFGHLFHSGGQQLGLIGPMYCGMTTVMVRWFSASRYWDLLREHGATTIDPIGPIIMALLAQPERASDREHSIRICVGSATGQIPRDRRDEFERRFGVRLHEVYAQTETGILLFTETPGDRREGSCGRAHGWADVSIRDDADMPLPPGTAGEIALRPLEPHTFMIEYWNNPRATLESWHNMWHHTGDLGHVDAEGYLFFSGRQAHWTRCRGENVSSYEVEAVAAQHPAVAEIAVVGVPSEIGDEDIKAYVRLADGAEGFDPAGLVGWCEERLAYFKVPRYVETIDELPRAAAKNEIDRSSLRARGVGDAWDRDAT